MVIFSVPRVAVVCYTCALLRLTLRIDHFHKMFRLTELEETESSACSVFVTNLQHDVLEVSFKHVPAWKHRYMHYSVYRYNTHLNMYTYMYACIHMHVL